MFKIWKIVKMKKFENNTSTNYLPKPKKL